MGLAVLLVVLGALGAGILRRTPSPQNQPTLPLKNHQTHAATQIPVNVLPEPAVVATPAPICWSCREPVIGPTLGCPSCGARYHGTPHGNCKATQLEQCVNCSGSSEHFVQA